MCRRVATSSMFLSSAPPTCTASCVARSHPYRQPSPSASCATCCAASGTSTPRVRAVAAGASGRCQIAPPAGAPARLLLAAPMGFLHQRVSCTAGLLLRGGFCTDRTAALCACAVAAAQGSRDRTALLRSSQTECICSCHAHHADPSPRQHVGPHAGGTQALLRAADLSRCPCLSFRQVPVGAAIATLQCQNNSDWTTPFCILDLKQDFTVGAVRRCRLNARSFCPWPITWRPVRRPALQASSTGISSRATSC